MRDPKIGRHNNEEAKDWLTSQRENQQSVPTTNADRPKPRDPLNRGENPSKGRKENAAAPICQVFFQFDQ